MTTTIPYRLETRLLEHPTRAWRARFGPFILSPSERLIEREGVPLRLGGRALDILIALVECAGEIVGKKELIARVWPNMVVEEGSLRFHIVAIRKALGDGAGGERYIVNTASKGYTFVGIVDRQELGRPINSPSLRRPAGLPSPATTVVGREAEIAMVLSLLEGHRFVSVVGAGGIGKTTVAISAAQIAAGRFGADVHFIDFSSLSGEGPVRTAVSTAVGLQNGLEDLIALNGYLSARKSLIVLDCCEHVIDYAAELAEFLVHGCPRLHIVATSREPMRAAGEFVYRLPPLLFPPAGEGLTANSALAYPAVRLFVERAAASGTGFTLKDDDAFHASQLCRQLGGIALAIELAASRIAALGLKGITSHFDASTTLMWHGRRTAVARHQTLSATLDWSFNLLSDREKQVVQRLAIFAGTFTIESAINVAGFDTDESDAIELISGLVSKSLLTVDAGGSTLRYGMLDTTKSYCRRKLVEGPEATEMPARFSTHFASWAQTHGALSKDEISDFHEEVLNLRAALDWEFSPDGQISDAVRFSAVLCPLMMRFSYVADCLRWAQLALAKLPRDLVGSEIELRLQGALGQSVMFARGGASGEAETAFQRSIELSERFGDARGTLHLLNGYVVLLHREGRYSEALETARRTQALLTVADDAESQAIVDSLLGVCLHLVGHVKEAMMHWEGCLAYTSDVSSDIRSKLGFDYHIRALCGLARSLWFAGSYRKALVTAEETLDNARRNGHAVTHCIALIWGGSVFTLGCDIERMRSVADELESVASAHALEPYIKVARILRGQILIAQGHPADGVERIRSAVERLHACKYHMVSSVALTFMAKGLSDMSLHSASLAMCDKVADMIETGGDFLRMPELLVTRGRCELAAGGRDEAEASYRTAMSLSSTHGLRSQELRAAIAYAQLLIGDRRLEDARNLLIPHIENSGNECSRDLEIARSLLN